MSEQNGKVCCNCRHCKRVFGSRVCKCRCDIDDKELHYIQVMTGWCRHWNNEREKEGADNVRESD